MLLFGCLVACPSILPRHLCYRCSPRIKSNVVGRFKKRHPISPFPAMTLWQNWTWLVVSSTSPYTPIYSVVFPLSTIPYVLFLRVCWYPLCTVVTHSDTHKGLWKKKSVPVVAKIGFSYLLVFVLFSIIGVSCVTREFV